MKIALFGYGRMGKMIAQIALQRGHTIVAKIDMETPSVDFSNVDVAIDFSMPNAAFENITSCINHGVPVISGTTGWLQDYDKAVVAIQREAHLHEGGIGNIVKSLFMWKSTPEQYLDKEG